MQEAELCFQSFIKPVPSPWPPFSRFHSSLKKWVCVIADTSTKSREQQWDISTFPQGVARVTEQNCTWNGPPVPSSGLIPIGRASPSLSLQTRWGPREALYTPLVHGLKELLVMSSFKCSILLGPVGFSAQCPSAWLEITPLELVTCGLKIF